MKISNFLFLGALFSVLLPLVFVQAGIAPFDPSAKEIPHGPDTIGEFVGVFVKIANWIFTILLAIALIFIVYAAFKFVTASGNPEEIEKARHMILFAVIGIIIAIVAKGIVRVVANIQS